MPGLPNSITGVVVLLVLIPGACFTWAYEKVRRGREGGIDVTEPSLTPGERVLLFLAAAVGYHVVAGWPEWALWRSHLRGHDPWVSVGRVALLWVGVAVSVALPLAAGLLAGRRWGQPRRDAWRHALIESGHCYLRAQLKEGAVLAGRFGSRSLASIGSNHDLFLQDAYEVLDDGTLGDPLGYAVFVPGDQVLAIEFIPSAAPTASATCVMPASH